MTPEQRQVFINDVVRLIGLLISTRRDEHAFQGAFSVLKHHILMADAVLRAERVLMDEDSFTREDIWTPPTDLDDRLP